MNKQVSPAVIAAVVVAIVFALGAIYYRQFVYTAPTPRPNSAAYIGTHNTSSVTAPGH